TRFSRDGVQTCALPIFNAVKEQQNGGAAVAVNRGRLLCGNGDAHMKAAHCLDGGQAADTGEELFEIFGRVRVLQPEKYLMGYFRNVAAHDLLLKDSVNPQQSFSPPVTPAVQ